MTHIYVMPQADAELAEGLTSQGAELVSDRAQATAVVLVSAVEVNELQRVLEEGSHVKWVQLPSAGIESYVDLMKLYSDKVWTSAKGSFARPVAEHGLALTLAVLRDLKPRSVARSWGEESGISLHGLRCVVVGAGGVAQELVRLYKAFDTHVTVVRRRNEPVPSADATVGFDRFHDALKGAHVVSLAAALTPETTRMIGATEIELLNDGAVITNVGRGGLIHQDALLVALISRKIRGAGLDVTSPEPLPQGHPLWDLENCLITPHTADTMEMVVPLLRQRILDNHRRIRDGLDPVGVADPQQGY